MAERLLVSLRVPVQSGWRQRDRVQVYGDAGTGTIDTTRPLLSRRLDMFPRDRREEVAPPGYARVPYASVPYGGRGPRVPHVAGWARYPYASVPYARGFDFIEVGVRVGQDFGMYKFAAQVIDGAGNVQGSLVEFSHLISGEDPRALRSFKFDSFDGPSDTVSFSFTE